MLKNDNSYRPDIDGLRAVAVLAVVFFHAFPIRVPGGFIGVDVFFVISGFLITSIITKEIEGARFSFLRFYARRARRIFPSLIVVLSATLAAGWLAFLADEFASVGKHAAGGAAFVSNFVLLFETGYFDPSAKFKPLLHLWSLGIEEQFYVVWPILLVSVAALGRQWRWLTAVVAAASLAYCFMVTRSNASSAFYLPMSRFWELMAGALLADRVFGNLLTRYVQSAAVRHSLSIAGLGLIAAGVYWTAEGSMFPAPMALLPVLGSMFLIVAGPTGVVNRWLLGNPIAVFVGLISYPLYLWHWPLLSIPTIVEGDYPPRETRITLVAVSFILATLTYLLVERPLRSSGKLLPKAAALFVGLAAVGGVGWLTFTTEGRYSQPADAAAQLTGPLWHYMSNDECKNRYPLPGSEHYGWWFCSLSKPQSPTIMLIGSSYANHHYPGFAKSPALADQTILSIGDCDPSLLTPADVLPNPDKYNPCTPEHRYAQQQLIDRIITNEPPKLIVIDGLNRIPTTNYVDRLSQRLTFFERAGAKIVIYLPSPTSDFFIRACFSRPFQRQEARSCDFDEARVLAAKVAFQPLVDEIHKRHPNIGFFDPNPLFCHEKKCSFVRDGLPLLRDEFNHLSEFASRTLTGMFLTWLRTECTDIARSIGLDQTVHTAR